MSETLKPCPFCSGSAIHMDRYGEGTTSSPRYAFKVTCQCGASLRSGWAGKASAIAAWNIRAPNPLQSAAAVCCPECGGRDKISSGPAEYVCQHCSDLAHLEEVENQLTSLQSTVEEQRTIIDAQTERLKTLIGLFAQAVDFIPHGGKLDEEYCQKAMDYLERKGIQGNIIRAIGAIEEKSHDRA